MTAPTTNTGSSLLTQNTLCGSFTGRVAQCSDVTITCASAITSASVLTVQLYTNGRNVHLMFEDMTISSTASASGIHTVPERQNLHLHPKRLGNSKLLYEIYLFFIYFLCSNFFLRVLQPLWRLFCLLGTSFCRRWGSKQYLVQLVPFRSRTLSLAQNHASRSYWYRYHRQLGYPPIQM